MAKKVYVGIGGKARKVKQIYIGIGGLARKVKKAYVGVGGVARPFWGLAEKVTYYGTIDTLSTSRSDAVGGSYNVRNGSTFDITAFISGGRSRTDKTAEVIKYDSNLVKTIGTPLSLARTEHGYGTSGLYTIFAGGSDADGNISNIIDVYRDGDTRLTHNFNTPRAGMGYASLDNYYSFFIGGIAVYDTGLSNIEYLNPAMVLSVIDLGYKTYNSVATAISTGVIFAGGQRDPSDYGSPTARAIDRSLTVMNITSLSNAKRGHGGATVSDYAVFGGGIYDPGTIDDTEYFQSVDAYDSEFTKIKLDPLIEARYGLEAISIDGYILFGPGCTYYPSPTYTNLVEVYDSDLVKQISITSSLARTGYAVANAGNYAILAGGSHSGGNGAIYDNIVEAFTTE